MRHEPRAGGAATPTLAVLAAGALAGMLQWTNGHYNPNAIVIVTAAWAVALVALFGRFVLPKRWSEERTLLIALGCCIATQLALLVTEPPTTDMVVGNPALMHLFNALLVLVALLAGMGLASRAPLRVGVDASNDGEPPSFVDKAWFPAAVALHFVMGWLVVRFVAQPTIDVWGIEMDSIRALLHGQNPYALTFPEGDPRFYPPSAMANGRLMFGFVYPPLSLLLCIPGYLLGGDSRWSTLVAMEIAALLMAYARPGRLSKLAALGFLFMPRTFFVMDHAWTDAFVVLLSAGVCFTALKKPRWAFVLIGMYVCLKQHMFLGIPALFMLLPRPIPWRPTTRLILKVAIVASVVTLPFVLWNPRAFAGSVLDIREVFRTDSLGLVAHLHNSGTTTLSKWIGLAAVVPVIAMGLWRAPRTPGGFALFAGTTHFTLYLFSTHAFCNEYYNVVASLYCAAAVWGSYDGVALVDPAPSSVTAAASAIAA